MTTRITVADLLQRNRQAKRDHHPLPLLSEKTGVRPKGTVIVSCCDPRCVPDEFLHVAADDGIAIIRNAAAKASRCVVDLATLDALIGLKEIMLVHHTDCGATYFTNERGVAHIRSYAPDIPGLDSIDFGAVPDVETGLRQEFSKLKNERMLRPELRASVKGYIFDIKTGEVKLALE